MDQLAFLRKESEGPHSQFHQFILALARDQPDHQYFFFEGEDDPIFYMGQIIPHLNNRGYSEYICLGRDPVVKAHELVARDGRASDRTHFFIDKDHNDILYGAKPLPPSIFQTEHYSFENYLVCEQVIRRFWVERLRLSSADQRLAEVLDNFSIMHKSALKKMRILMAFILLGRGVEGHPELKLNLNNVQLDRVFALDFSKKRLGWKAGGITYFLNASNMIASGFSGASRHLLRTVCQKHLGQGMMKSYVRGKYELWFFVMFLSAITRDLSNREAAKISGQPRAKPSMALNIGSSIEQLASLTPPPASLTLYAAGRLAKVAS